MTLIGGEAWALLIFGHNWFGAQAHNVNNFDSECCCSHNTVELELVRKYFLYCVRIGEVVSITEV